MSFHPFTWQRFRTDVFWEFLSEEDTKVLMEIGLVATSQEKCSERDENAIYKFKKNNNNLKFEDRWPMAKP